MIMKKKQNKTNKILILFVLISLIFIISFYSFTLITNNNLKNYEKEDSNNIKSSSYLATLNLTNYDEINGNMYAIGDSITIKGLVYKEFPNYTLLSDIDVTLKIDNQLRAGYTNTTNGIGEFVINYVIESSLNVYQSHLVQVQVTDPAYPNLSDVYYPNSYSIDVNSTSYFSVSKGTTSHLPNENLLDLNGYLFFENGSAGIPYATIRYQWYDALSTLIGGTMITSTGPNGEIPSNIRVPSSALAGDYKLYIEYPTNPGIAEFSYTNITNIEIFRDITCNWNNQSQVEEGQDIVISGKIVDSADSLRVFKNRDFEISYDGDYKGDTTTDNNGDFSFPYIIPGGLGTKTISIDISTGSAYYSLSNSWYSVNVSQAPVNPPSGLPLSPLQWFFIIGGPIIAGAIGIVGYFGYKRFNQRLLASQTIVIELEQRILNLKILKDSGRIEEALSYLFNSIYIELVSKKYGRIKKPNETIRDFAIISVRDFKLDPSKVYPFIQKVEEIIYARPFQISDKEFYETVNLFSPIYHYLTGSNFVLNF